MQANWQDPEDYRFTRELSAAQWAWEFLRRNPDYRREWQAFWATWQALEADYGKAPNRDFPRWKDDPRAYVIEAGADCDSEGCKVDGEKVLIECHLGARWGFYKFPLNPAHERPVIGQDLLWREHPLRAQPLAGGDIDGVDEREGKLALVFDLRMPLKEQLAAAKPYLIASQRRLQQEGLERRSVASECAALSACLRLLDAREAGAGEGAICKALGLESSAAFAALSERALSLMQGGYRELLHLPPR